MVNGFTLLTDEELEAAGLHKGSIGPKGLPGGIKVIGDVNLKNIERWVVGANEDGFHFVGAKHGEDFQVDEWADLSLVMPGDACPRCGAALQGGFPGIPAGRQVLQDHGRGVLRRKWCRPELPYGLLWCGRFPYAGGYR